jgi:Zn finger protein HypA/HybF involved in hydrogenase expression
MKTRCNTYELKVQLSTHCTGCGSMIALNYVILIPSVYPELAQTMKKQVDEYPCPRCNKKQEKLPKGWQTLIEGFNYALYD